MHEQIKQPEVVESLVFEHVEPLRECVLRAVGVDPGRKAHHRWLPVVDEYLRDMPRLMRPRAVFRIDAVTELTPRRLRLASGVEYEGAVGRFLKHSVYVASFVVTIGSAMERLARRWMKGAQIMRGAIVDAVASEGAEATAERLQQHVRDWARARGMDVTPRYSPGYCGMTVRQQIPLFSSLETRDIRVRLTPSCLMLPIKSVSGLIGLAPADRVDPLAYPCESCEHPHCMQRRAPFVRGDDDEFDWATEESTPKPAS